MPSEVRHLVDADHAFPLVQLTGAFDRETAPQVRAALLDVLAGQPEAVVVDVAGLHVTQPEAVTTLRELRQETAGWPAARLALCDAGDAGRWGDSGWPVWPSSAEAFSSFGSPHLDQRFSFPLQPKIGAARQSREAVSEVCHRWGRAELAGSASIVVTEMVNNVVTHARTPMTVLLAVRGTGLSVAVRDESTATPSFTGAPALTSYGGRGMLLIDSVAEAWGNLVLSHGKVVWALLGENWSDGLDRNDAGLADPARG